MKDPVFTAAGAVLAIWTAIVIATFQLMKSDRPDPPTECSHQDADTPAETACAEEARRRHLERLRDKKKAWETMNINATPQTGEGNRKPPEKTLRRDAGGGRVAASDDGIVDEQIATARAEAVRLAPEIAAQQNEWLSEYEKRHAEDVAGYRFDCMRFGDFLQIKVERRWNDQEFSETRGFKPYDVAAAKFAATINLGRVSRIEIDEGWLPDLKGARDFYATLPSEGYYGTEVVEDRLALAPRSAQWGLGVPFLLPRYPKGLVRQYPEAGDGVISGGYIEHGGRMPEIGVQIVDAAREARDDVIKLVGWGEIYAPAGEGEKVLAAIHAELKRGAEPVDAAALAAKP